MSSENPDTVESSRWIFVVGLFLAPPENGGARVALALIEKEPLWSTVNVDPDCQVKLKLNSIKLNFNSI